MEIKNGALSLTGMKTTWKERPDGVKADPAISERHIALK